MATPVFHPATPSRSRGAVTGSERMSISQTVDELLSAETSRLSLLEKYQMDLDVRGKNLLAAVEPPELSSMGLEALNAELKSRKDTKFYNMALNMNSKMVMSPEFKLRFARAESFDPVKATSRIEKHLELLYKNFGKQGLLRAIRMSDLDKAEQDLLKSGAVQVLPCRDRAGRRIIARFSNFGSAQHSDKNKVRVAMYLMQVISEDEETQKQGGVLVSWPQQGTYSGNLTSLRHVFLHSAHRISAFHICFGEEQHLASFAAQTVLLAVPEIRARCRIHVGSVTECQYALMTYSIPSEYLPITNTGNLKTQNHNKWLTYLEAKETALEEGVPFDGIDCPSLKDILAGKGPLVSNHPGNVEFRKIMESRFKEHRNATIIERKTAITWEVVLECQRRGARFLIKDKNWWVVADQDTARDKVSVAFRDMRKSFTSKQKAESKKRSEAQRHVDVDVKKRKSSNDE